MDFRPRHLVLFDIDGTLVDLHPREVEAYLAAFDTCFGIRHVDDDWSKYKSRTDIGVAQEILEKHFGRPCSPEEVDHVLATYMESLQRDVLNKGIIPEFVPGVAALLESLVERGDTALALATGNVKRAAELRLKKRGIWQNFVCGAFAEDGQGKNEIVRQAITRAYELWPNLREQRAVVLVGDQATDAHAALENGIYFIGVCPATCRDRLELLKSIGAAYVFTDFSEPGAFIADLETLLESKT